LPEVIDLLLLGAGQMVTCSCPEGVAKRGKKLDDPVLVNDGAVAITGGKILYSGTREAVLSACESLAISETIDVGGRVILPGWVDPHTHAVFSSYRSGEFEDRIRGTSYLEIEKRGGGIMRTVREVREIGEDELFKLSMIRARKLLELGTTTIEIKSGYGLNDKDELKMLRVIRRVAEEGGLDVVATFLGAHQKPPEFESSREYIEFIISEVMPVVSRDSLAEFVDVFCEEGVFSVEESRRLLEAGRDMGFGLKIHADEINSIGGTRLAVELDAISADHLTKVSDDDIDALSSSDTIAVLLPATTFGLASSSFAPARKLVDRGAAIALATDYNPGSSPTNSMQFVVSIACSQMHLTPAEAINAATINSAFAIGMADVVGSIEPGKKADLVVYDIGDYREIPSRPGVNHACIVIKDGKKVWEREGYGETSEVGI